MDNWSELTHGQEMIRVMDKGGPYRFRCDPVPFGRYGSSYHWRNCRMIGYLRAKADRETGRYVRIGHMDEFRGVQDECSRVWEKSWKSQSKRKHQWK